MRVLLKLQLDCEPDAAWRAIRSPAGLTGVSAPLMVVRSLEPGGFPELWTEGPHATHLELFGLAALGEQVIDIEYLPARGDIRLMRDRGYARRGPITAVTRWQHTMAIAPAPGGRTLYRDELKFEAGALSPIMWPMFWAFWQWRALRMTRLARQWR